MSTVKRLPSSPRRPSRFVLPSDSEAYLAILFTLADAKTPLTQSAISKQSGLQRQHVHYYIKRLIRDGVVIPATKDGETLYALQPFFRDEDLVDHTYKLMESLVWLLRKNMDFSQVPAEDLALERALSNNIILFCALFSRDVRIAVEKRP